MATKRKACEEKAGQAEQQAKRACAKKLEEAEQQVFEAEVRLARAEAHSTHLRVSITKIETLYDVPDQDREFEAPLIHLREFAQRLLAERQQQLQNAMNKLRQAADDVETATKAAGTNDLYK